MKKETITGLAMGFDAPIRIEDIIADKLMKLYHSATVLSRQQLQTTREKREYYITLEQLNELMKSL